MSVPGAAKIARACDARGKEEEEDEDEKEFIQNRTGLGAVCDLVWHASTRMATSASTPSLVQIEGPLAHTRALHVSVARLK